MLSILASVLHDTVAGTPWWAVIGASLLSGAGAALFSSYHARKLIPSQVRELDSSAARDAVESVSVALNVARGRVDSLEAQVRENSRTISELKGRLMHEQSDRQRIGDSLNLALAERARLEQQIIDINRILGTRRVQDLAEDRSIEAIVMVDLVTGIMSYVNEGVFSLLGYMPSALIGEHLSILIPEGLRKTHADRRADFAKNPQTRPMGIGLALVARRVDGTTIPVEISLHPTGDGRVLALMRRRIPPQTDHAAMDPPAAPMPVAVAA